MSLFIAISITACSHSEPKADNLSSSNLNPYTEPSTPAPASEWPKTMISGEQEISVYRPQVESWNGDTIKERAVVSVQTPASPNPVYGLIWLTAKTQTDSKTQRVSFDDVQITKAEFPSAPELSSVALKAIRENESSLLKPVALANLQSSLAIEQAEAKSKPNRFRNAPPKIIVTHSPSLLVLVDGTPVFRDSGVPGLTRVINTRALILYDSAEARYSFFMGNRWVEAQSLQGPWTEIDHPSSSLEQAKRLAVDQNQVDLLNGPNSPLMKRLDQNIVPRVYVSTEPAALLEINGKPELQSIAGTELLFVKNSKDSIFLDQKDQNYYVLISGRWFRGRSLDGPWYSLSAKELPKDFAKIPESHRKGGVLASVPGTQQAGEAAISSQVPQTAAVDRNQAKLEVQYDGPAKFQPIEQTPLRYAVNSRIPVIEVDPHSFYALKAGVWFTSTSPDGPWKVADQVPAVIYTIPPSSPIYYVTYVHVYDSTPQVVYVSYLPGYLGTYCCSDGVVVYGTGYYYPPWIGSYWIGPPVTFGIGFYGGAAFYPWWGPWWGVPVYVGYPYYPYYVAPGSTTVGQVPVYSGWSSSAVQSSNNAAHASSFQNAYTTGAGQWASGVNSALPGATGSMAGQGVPSAEGWQTRPPEATIQDVSPWNPPPPQNPGVSSAPWSTGPSPGSAPGIASGLSQAPAAPAMPAAPPPAPAAPMAPGPSAGNAGALAHGFGGGGWGAHK